MFKLLISRRKILKTISWSTLLLGFGGGLGWLWARFKRGSVAKLKSDVFDFDEKGDNGISNTYDLEAFRKIDPKHILYREVREIALDFKKTFRIASGYKKIGIAGDRRIDFFSEAGEKENSLTLPRPAHCLHFAEGRAGEITVGFLNHFEIYSPAGKKVFTSKPLGERVYLTSIDREGERFFLADAGNKRILIYQRGRGVIKSFGDKDPGLGNPGFAVPSPYFDLSYDRDKRQLYVANPGRLRIESYSLEGVFLSSWGKAGMAIHDFCGCCNPVYFKRDSKGLFTPVKKA